MRGSPISRGMLVEILQSRLCDAHVKTDKMKEELQKIIKAEMKNISAERKLSNMSEMSDSHNGSLFAFINLVYVFFGHINFKLIKVHFIQKKIYVKQRDFKRLHF